jgi:hypothetical protein
VWKCCRTSQSPMARSDIRWTDCSHDFMPTITLHTYYKNEITVIVEQITHLSNDADMVNVHLTSGHHVKVVESQKTIREKISSANGKVSGGCREED